MKIITKTTIVPVIATNETQLKQALDNHSKVISIENPLYSSVVENVKKSQRGKLISGGGSISSLLGIGLLILGGPFGWSMLLGGGIVSILGNSIDSLKNYTVDIDEVSCRITLYLATGKDKYKASKHQIIR